MDGQRFDDLARVLAHSATRRTVWRGTLALASSWLAIRPNGPAAAQDGCAPAHGSCDDTTPCCNTPEYACCNGTCVSVLDGDPANCGACGTTCSEGGFCCGGICTPPLDSNNCIICGHVCDLCEVCVESNNGIRGCGRKCGPTESCDNGVCTECPSNLSGCGKQCVDLQTDNYHCGRCDVDCTGAEAVGYGVICIDGQCVCPPGQELCGDGNGTCTDVMSNVENCGGCWRNCLEYLPGSICVGGECVCPDSSNQCGNVCADLATDPANCGGCGISCENGMSCLDGVCQVSGGGSQSPSLAPTPTTDPVTLPNTGTGARGRPSNKSNEPLVGAIIALSATAAAWLRGRGRASDGAAEE